MMTALYHSATDDLQIVEKQDVRLTIFRPEFALQLEPKGHGSPIIINKDETKVQ